MKKIIKNIKVFPTGSFCITLRKAIKTPEELEQFKKELNEIR